MASHALLSITTMSGINGGGYPDGVKGKGYTIFSNGDCSC